ncbi:SDR family oxidoreductase [Oscillochloris sp. ZM17-4]|uniref:SDR family oxidoreductase n=1 Tax=Oscillochloris sp. ZM17-4 TaxID=2866714 RepID=UPI001C7341A6|nr:SDR family oxidoreductase [Oscillochloris sp. ZM17-4]MBX0329682.1 SDR family oxidoreductase [Oscillochloris sp. ZM17-4]
MKTVLIAGATGYLGRYAVHAFKHAGYRVRVLARSEQKLALPGAGLAPAISDCIDEIHIGDVTQPETLRGITNGIDVVFSSISMMGAKSKHTWHDVDYLGNLTILNEARKTDVAKFVFISVFNAAKLMHVPMVKAHEDFAADLAASGLAYTVIRPTGYFSDMGALLQMAQSGRVYLLGDGTLRINPIHGADLARVSVDAVTMGASDIDVGGPEVHAWDDIAAIACAAAGQPPKVTRIPLPLARAGVGLLRPFKRRMAQLLDFFVSSAALESVAPQAGTRRLADHYDQLLANRPLEAVAP